MGGGINLEMLARLQALEDQVSRLRQELSEVKSSRGGNDYGLVKLSASGAVTNSTGLALPTSENNAGLTGTLANRIATTQNRVANTFSKIWIQNGSESDDEGGHNWIVGKTYTSTENFSNFNAFSMDMFWHGGHVYLPYYTNETDNLISGSISSFTGENILIIESVRIRYQRGSSTYSIDAAGSLSVSTSGTLNVREFKPGEVIYGFALYGLNRWM